MRPILATAAAATLTLVALVSYPGSAAASTSQPGPTQIVNDQASAAAVVVRDNNAQRFHLRRGGYVLHDTDTQFFTTFYVSRGTKIRFYATDPYGNPMPGVLQEETTAGWHQTNDEVDDADLVLIKVYSTVTVVQQPPTPR